MTGRTRRCTLVAAIALAIATPVAAAATTADAPSSPPAAYRIRSGDTLTTVAARMHLRGGWQQLYEANRRTVGADPNRLVVGTVLVRPGAAMPASGATARPALAGAAARPASEASIVLADTPPPPSPGTKKAHVVVYALAGAGTALALLLGLVWWRDRRNQLDSKKASWYVTPPVFLGNPHEPRVIDVADREVPTPPRFGISQADVILRTLQEGRR